MGRLTEDICGKSFGKLTALKFAGYENNKAMWFCACSCRNFIVVRAGALKSGNTKSCGCYRSSFLVGGDNHKPSVKNTAEYNSWRAIKGRCYDSNNIAYEKYGGRGIEMDVDFKNSFESFLSYIGTYPEDGKRYTVDRIDNNLGYIKGNIRWATYETQSKNTRTIPKSTTEVVGVHYRITKKGHSYFVATWSSSGKRQQKLFSIDKLGELVALRDAVACRLDNLIRLSGIAEEYSYEHIRHLEEKLKELEYRKGENKCLN